MDSPAERTDHGISRRSNSLPRQDMHPSPSGDARPMRSPETGPAYIDPPSRRDRRSPQSMTPSPRMDPSRSRSHSRSSSPGSGRGGYRGRTPSHWRSTSARYTDKCTVYVGGLPFDTRNEDVADFFERYGEIAEIKLIYHHETQEFRGFGFVTFQSQHAADEAAHDANGHEILGSRIRCNIAKYGKGQPRGHPRDDRWYSYDMDGPPSPHMGGPPPSVSYRPRYVYHSGDWSRESPPRSPPYSWARARPSSPKRRRRSLDPDEDRYNGEGPDEKIQKEMKLELKQMRDELMSARSECEQMQREQVQLKTQLDELTVQANSKLSDQRAKIKLSKRRSMARGKQMLSLFEAVKNVHQCQEAVTSAEKSLAEAKKQLLQAYWDAENYVISERAEDEAEDKERAECDTKRMATGSVPKHASEYHPIEPQTTPVKSPENPGLTLKPFRITLDKT